MNVRADIAGAPVTVLELRLRAERPPEAAAGATTSARGVMAAWPIDPPTLIDFWHGSPWLGAVGNALADAISAADWELRARETRLDGASIKAANQDEYARARAWLARENVGRDGSMDLDLPALLRATALHFDNTGNVFLEAIRSLDARELVQLGVLLPQFQYLEPGADGVVRLLQRDPFRGEYRFIPFGSRKTADEPREYLHHRLPNLVSSFYGLPAWITARDSVTLDNAHRAYLKGFFTNHGSPRWMLEITQDPAWVEKGGVMPGEDVVEKVYEGVRSYLSANRGDMSGRNLILRYPGGILVKATPLDVKVEDPTFGATAKNARDEIMAVRHVSLIDLGLPEGGYRATAETQSDNFRRNVLEPFAAPAVAILNRVLHAPAPFGLGVTEWDFALTFDRVDDTLARIKGITVGTGVPILTPNEGRQLAGYEIKPGVLDEVHVPASFVPASEELGNPDAPALDATA